MLCASCSKSRPPSRSATTFPNPKRTTNRPAIHPPQAEQSGRVRSRPASPCGPIGPGVGSTVWARVHVPRPRNVTHDSPLSWPWLTMLFQSVHAAAIPQPAACDFLRKKSSRRSVDGRCGASTDAETMAGGLDPALAPDGLPVSAHATQHRREPLIVSAFLAYKAREWHMCAIEGRVRRSSPCEKAQVSPPVFTEGLA